MPVPSRLAALARSAITVWYLAIQTTSDIAPNILHICCDRQDRGPRRRRMAKMCRYYFGYAVNPRTYFAVDGDGDGRRRQDLDPAARQQRRVLADLRRRHATMLLHTLGDTADAVEATLTQHWQIYGGDDALLLVEDYLLVRLRWRDRPVRHQIDIYPWASNISGVWVATPAPVRHYLDRARDHELRLDAAYSPHPRRGVRAAPAPQPA